MWFILLVKLQGGGRLESGLRIQCEKIEKSYVNLQEVGILD